MMIENYLYACRLSVLNILIITCVVNVQVYQQVCSACHSLKYLSFRNLVGVTHTEEEVKAIAAEAMVEDGPDDTGAMFMRPGKLSDRMPGIYTFFEMFLLEGN